MIKARRRQLEIFIVLILSFVTSLSESNERTVSLLKHDVYTLAQPAWKGRLVGSQGNAAARKFIIDRFRELQLTPVGPNQSYEQVFKGINLIGYIQPKANTSCILIGAHYDGKGEEDGEVLAGADDNASGVAVLLETVRRIKEREAELQTCVIIAAWDFEEGSFKTRGGIKGSRFFVENPLIPLDRIELTVTFDLLGGHLFKGLKNSLFVFGTESSSSLRHLLSATSQTNLSVMPFTTDVLEPFGPRMPRSDYGPFRDQGVPFVFFSTGTPYYYHRSSDTAEKLDYEQMSIITDYVFNFLWPILIKKTTVARGESYVTIRLMDARQAAIISETLFRNADKNAVSEDHKLMLLQDARHLEALADQKKVDVCHVQISFLHILESLDIRSPLPVWLLAFIKNLRCTWP